MSNRLLIADDVRGCAEMLAALLEQEGFEVAVAFDGEEAIRTALAFNPDVLILDLDMPVADGFQVAKRLHAMPQFAGKHFVALTSHSDQQFLDEASQAEFDDYLFKPCELALLKTILLEALSAKQAAVTK